MNTDKQDIIKAAKRYFDPATPLAESKEEILGKVETIYDKFKRYEFEISRIADLQNKIKTLNFVKENMISIEITGISGGRLSYSKSCEFTITQETQQIVSELIDTMITLYQDEIKSLIEKIEANV